MMLNPTDIEAISLEEDSPVKITTEYGSVNVNWSSDVNLDPGIAFFPYGPWANQVYDSKTGSTGMPIMKGISANIEKSTKKVLTLIELVEKLKEPEK